METSMVVTTTLPPPPYPEGGGGSNLQQSVFPMRQMLLQQSQQKDTDGMSNSVMKLCGSLDSKSDDVDDEAVESQKKMVYKHPLFPLMALLFEKCEQATQTPECPSSESFDIDIQAFVQHQDVDNRPILVNDAELDGLMVKAIQVLRIHLLELEKVNDLCKDFCLRYISCLKGKLQSEQLLHIEGMESPEHDSSMLESPSSQTCNPSNVTLAPGQIMSGNTVYQMVQTPQGLVAQPIQTGGGNSAVEVISPPTTPIQGSTPLSQIGGLPSSPDSPATPVQPILPLLSCREDDDSGSGSAKRGILPKQATQIMKTWLFQHIVHPYPTEDEKKTLALQTGLSILQINNWFINARRRILQPMLDNANPDGAKKKPKPPTTRPQKYWPENLAQLSSHTPPPVSVAREVDGRGVPGDESLQSLQHRISVSSGQLVETNVADLLQGMAHMVQSTNPDVSSMISNVQQATSAIVSQNGQLDASLNIGHLRNATLDNT